MSISTGPAAAIVAASGFIWSMNGQIVAATPTVANEPVIRKSKSRFETEAPPWPSAAVSELIVIKRASSNERPGILKTSAPNEGPAQEVLYPPPAPLATARAPPERRR